MLAKIKLIVSGVEATASINTESRIGGLVFNRLPIKSKFNTWGDELYFPVKLKGMEITQPSLTVAKGDLAYSAIWRSFCLFYGKTPISNDIDIIPNGPVEVFGKLDDDPSLFKRILSGTLKNKRRRICNRIRLLHWLIEDIRMEKVAD